MVEKISINIKVPSLNVEHNFLVPIDMSVGVTVGLIEKTLLEEYPGVKKSLLNTKALMQLSTGKILALACNLRQLGIIQGEKLLLL